MEAIVTRQNQPFLVYNQGPALHLLPLPLISPVRPKMIARDFQGSLICHALEAELILLYENTAGQIVLLFHNPETGQQRYLPLLSPNPDESYQDFFLWQIQGRLYFFYTVYTPFDGRCRLLYKLPLEHLESRPAAELETDPGQTFTDCLARQAEDAEDVSASETVKEEEEENQRQRRELEATIEHISAQYQELYDYTLALQKEARKWRDLAHKRQENYCPREAAESESSPKPPKSSEASECDESSEPPKPFGPPANL